MNSNDLFEIIGETPGAYVLDAEQETKNIKQGKRRSISKILLIAALISLLSATIATAAGVLVRVKYQNSFTSTATEPLATGAPTIGANQDEDISDVDVSKNGVIEFRIDIDEEICGELIPSLEVVPHFLSEEDIKRVAYILFPEGEFYEAEPDLQRNFSKAEIQEKIDLWSDYSTEDALRELFGYRPNQPEYLPEIAEIVRKFIEEYTGLLESAPTENPHKLCDWTFKKSSFYWLTKEEFAAQDTSNENDDIIANIKIGDVRYRFSASVRDGDDFLICNIHAYPYDGISPNGISDRIYQARLCRTAEPTAEQVEGAKRKAEAMLAQMQLGQWLVDECYVEKQEINEYTYYSIHVNAVPVLNGIPALRKAQLENLRSDLPGAARLYYTDVQFEFSAKGDLVFFSMKSPLEVKDVVAADMAELDIEQQFRIAEEYLSRKSFYAYSMGMEVTFGHQDDPIGCIANITGLEYNLTRINGADPLESYYYVPGIKLTGSVKYYNLKTGEVYLERQDVVFAIIDASEGTVVLTP